MTSNAGYTAARYVYGKREAYNGVENRDVCIEFLGGLGLDMMDFMDFLGLGEIVRKNKRFIND